MKNVPVLLLDKRLNLLLDLVDVSLMATLLKLFTIVRRQTIDVLDGLSLSGLV